MRSYTASPKPWRGLRPTRYRRPCAPGCDALRAPHLSDCPGPVVLSLKRRAATVACHAPPPPALRPALQAATPAVVFLVSLVFGMEYFSVWMAVDLLVVGGGAAVAAYGACALPA